MGLLDATFARESLRTALSARGAPPTQFQALLSPYVRASSLGSCGRATVLKARFPQQIIGADAEASLAMLQGDWAEDGMRTLLLEAGFLIRDSQRELNFHRDGQEVLRGHIDGIVGYDYGALGTTWMLWENKAMSAYRFKKLNLNGVGMSSPEYMIQMQTYMWLLRQEGESLDAALFTAVAKDPSAVNMGNRGPKISGLYIEVIPFNEEQAEEYILRGVGLQETIQNGGMWPHERTPGKDWDCSERFCSVYALCDPKSTMKRR